MMQKKIENIFRESVAVKGATLIRNKLLIEKAVALLTKTFRLKKKLLIFGNGGSAADSQHLAAEFVGRFKRERKGLPAIALTTDTSALTALGNDYTFDIIFARQVEALGQKGDVAIGFSTSGRSRNVIEGLKTAKRLGLKTISLTGRDGGPIAKLTDVSIVVPSNVTARIQEAHLVTFHTICELVEDQFAR